MTGRQTWSGWPSEGYRWRSDEGYIQQPQPSYGHSQGGFFNHSSILEPRDETLNQSWGFEPQTNFQNPYTPATSTHSSQPYLHQDEYYPPNQDYQQPQISFEDKWLDKMDLFEKRFLEMSNSVMEILNRREATIQPHHDEASHCDEGLRVFEEVEIEKSLFDEDSRVFEEIVVEGSQGDEEKEIFKGGKLEEKEDTNFELEEFLFDGECGSNGDLGSEFCESSNDMECESNGDLQVEPCDVLSSTNPRFDFEDFWNDVECESSDESRVETCDEPNTQYHEPTPQNLPNPSSCQTIHYTELDISGVMFVDLPTN